MVPSLWNTVQKFLKMFNIELPFDPAIPLLGIHPREMKTFGHTKICTWKCLASLSLIAEKYKQPKCPSTNESIDKI